MTSFKNDNYRPNYITPPGLTLEETLESLHMPQSELAQRISRPEKTISEIINGTSAITPETAIQLERALGVPASFWNNLEKNFQEQKARINAKSKLENEIGLLKNFPYSIMAKFGWITKSSNKNEQVDILLSYFGVNSLALVPNIMQIKYRKHQSKKEIPQGSVAAWLRKGEIDSAGENTNEFNAKLLKSDLVNLKTLSNLVNVDEFIPQLKSTLAKYGIVLIFTRALPNTYICGASRWLNPNKALIQLSIRGSYADIMWFTLYHELGHLLLHSKKEGFVDAEDQMKSGNGKVESEANNFASDALIPSDKYEAFKNNVITRRAIRELAEESNIHPGILVGRLQHEQVIKFSEYPDLRIRYKWI